MHRFAASALFVVFTFGFQACGPESVNKRSSKDQTPIGLEGSCEDLKSKKFDEAELTVSAKKQFKIRTKWIKGPEVEEYNTAGLVFYNADGSVPEKVAVSEVLPWMKIHGHGTGDEKAHFGISECGPNIFIVSNVFFIMSGPWELNIKAKVDERSDAAEILVNVPK